MKDTDIVLLDLKFDSKKKIDTKNRKSVLNFALILRLFPTTSYINFEEDDEDAINSILEFNSNSLSQLNLSSPNTTTSTSPSFLSSTLPRPANNNINKHSHHNSMKLNKQPGMPGYRRHERFKTIERDKFDHTTTTTSSTRTFLTRNNSTHTSCHFLRPTLKLSQSSQ